MLPEVKIVNVDVQLPCRFVDILNFRYVPSHVTLVAPAPSHSWHECIYVVRGLYLVKVQGRSHRLTDGQCAVFPAGLLHHADTDAPARGEVDLLEMLILQWQAAAAPAVPVILSSVSPRVPELLRWLADIRLRHSASVDVLNAIVFAFLNELAQSSATGSLVRLVHDYMQGFVNRQLVAGRREKVSLTALAENAGLSKFHFLREFKKQSGGRTPLEYMQEFRAARAQELLTQTDLSLAEIAERLGFSRRNYLAHFVASHFGAPPRALRRRRRRPDGGAVTDLFVR